MLVLGHTNCGAVDAASSKNFEKLELNSQIKDELRPLNQGLWEQRALLKTQYKNLTPAKWVEIGVDYQVKQVRKNRKYNFKPSNIIGAVFDFDKTYGEKKFGRVIITNVNGITGVDEMKKQDIIKLHDLRKYVGRLTVYKTQTKKL